MPEIAQSAQELETLVARAARRGRIDIEELLAPYRRLRPGNHPHLADERRVDLDAMVSSLAALPPGFLDASELLVVPRLEPYDHEPLDSGMLPAGLLADGTLLIEASFSHVSLVNLAAPLCALAHEVEKAQSLLAGAGLIAASSEPAAPGDTEVDGPSHLFGDAAPEPGAAPDLELAVAEPTEVNGDAQVAATLARIAFALGVDQTALEAADDSTDGRLLRLLLRQAELPAFWVHADLAPDATARRVVDHHGHILNRLAEMGLMDRPAHLWLGGGVISECLSPYVRDLRQVLVTWARENPGLCGDDITLQEPAGEDLLYALAHDFLLTDPHLERERETADRTVGIQRYPDATVPFEIIDLGRLEPGACDARLPPWPPLAAPAPILLRVTPDLEDTEGSGVSALLHALAPQLKSVTLVLEGTAVAGGPGTIVLPQIAVRWAGEHKVFIPNTAPLAADSFLGFADAAVQEGALLSVSAAALLSPEHVSALARSYGVAAIEVGAAGLVNAVADARWRGELPAAVDLRWALVSTVAASTGRPDLPSLSGYAAVAVAALRQMLIPPRADPEPPPRQQAAEPIPPRPGRSVIIKA
jgi:hypothetical protein